MHTLVEDHINHRHALIMSLFTQAYRAMHQQVTYHAQSKPCISLGQVSNLSRKFSVIFSISTFKIRSLLAMILKAIFSSARWLIFSHLGIWCQQNFFLVSPIDISPQSFPCIVFFHQSFMSPQASFIPAEFLKKGIPQQHYLQQVSLK